MATLNIKRYDTRTAIKATLLTPGGNAVELTGAIVKFVMVKYGVIIANRQADVIDAINGRVAFTFTREELTETGPMKAEFEVTYTDGAVETFPNEGYIAITIEADLA